ncbi:ribonucleotide reductase inhibitor-domain-containing protein [Amylocarpus encephaloides]|uniref:Ribonucleotide reductase inhibitor-domain-containing protein n=1 Tax=Amylocarpus encephaloides TaxID=45428 RepID=A0A9P7YGK5_9HELO|nr:ribonucleotide reductase inhibitor-domain-containing protein [Amylocarpus encephaloides]
MAHHHHQAKRPYHGSQPPITTYLFAQSPSSPSQYSISHDQQPIPQHQLPPAVQSNLLSVGMRVRKSVPEGYKTGTASSAFALCSDPPVAATRAESQAISPRTTRPRARELTPFCGILKVGGLAQQAWGIHGPAGHAREAEAVDGEEMEEEDVPFLSQGSTISDSSVEGLACRRFSGGAVGNKRGLEEEEIDLAVRHCGVAGREIAVPRRRRGEGKLRMGEGKRIPACGQENSGVLDFGDAEFLDYEGLGVGERGEEVEVEMGGV